MVDFGGIPMPDVIVNDGLAGQVHSTEQKELDLKKRHLTRSERDRLHKPDPDWTMVGKKEVCHSACTLVVDDLLE
jgi:hypothetical protein